MSENLQNNPFSGLFTSVCEAESYTNLSVDDNPIPLVKTSDPVQNIEVNSENGVIPNTVDDSGGMDDVNVRAKNVLEVNQMVENIFQFTLRKNDSGRVATESNSSKQLIFLEDLANAVSPQDWIDLDTLEQALFERLLLENPIKHAIIKDQKDNIVSDTHAFETEVIPYLFECHRRLLLTQTSSKYSNFTGMIPSILEFVSRNAATALRQTELFDGQELHLQILALFNVESASIADISSFFNGISHEFLSEDGKEGCVETLSLAFQPTLVYIHKEMARADLFTFKHSHFKLLQVFAGNNELSLVLLSYSSPSKKNVGRNYSDTLLGSILCLSCLPKSSNGEFEYFDKNWNSQDGISVVEGNVWCAMQTIQENVYSVFHSLLKCSPEVKHKILCWLGECLHANAARGRLENLSFSFPSPRSLLCVSDGFMINLSGVLLRLCQPFCSNPQDLKLLRIDPTYCAASKVNDPEMHSKGIHLSSMAEETCLIPVEDGMERPVAQEFGFVTECFFMTHRALDLGFCVVMEGLTHVNRDMSRIEQAIRSSQIRPDMLQALQERLDDGIKKFKSLRASLLEPKALKMMSQLHLATAVWLTQVNVHHDLTGQKSYAPNSFRKVKFPLAEQVPPTLSCVPEFLIENKCSFLSFVRRFSPQTLEDEGLKLLEPLLTQILVFMGSIHRMRNPHLRARLAEALESLLPDQTDSPRLQPVSIFYREQLFKTHPYRTQIIVSLLDVFVGIEMTGQSVEFEQKFNYRRPMYLVMKYLWNIEEQKDTFRKLAKDAEKNMEAVTPPLFLRFINLLINDAVFLLDEALTNMAQLRQMQTARDAPNWEQLSPSDREQHENSMLHTGMIARFDNILGRETIQTLLFLTSDIKNIFNHPTMVDRIAAMLNYFLYNLVGPKMKNFKVKDQKEFEFEPATIVRFICEIYVHLCESDSFCMAVSQDGRSYSPQLFKLAEDVLARTGGGVLIVDLQSVAAKVAHMASKQQTEDELLAEAPEDFLDPIMNTLMTDPVILPSSNKTIDRSTIARHILSDQSDPFNRSPLTMDMVKPNDELRGQIQAWVQEKRDQKKN